MPSGKGVRKLMMVYAPGLVFPYHRYQARNLTSTRARYRFLMRPGSATASVATVVGDDARAWHGNTPVSPFSSRSFRAIFEAYASRRNALFRAFRAFGESSSAYKIFSTL